MISLKNYQKNFFKENGYLIIENFIDKKTVNILRKASFDLFKGKYQTNIVPDKIKWSVQNSKIKKGQPRQLCNVWKSNYHFASVILSKKIGKLASELMKWNGVRLSQDSLIWVPPKSGGVSMHQDNVYQDWHIPGKLITGWIALTDISKNNGGIEFLPGSHTWKKLSKPAKKFFSGGNYKHTLNKFKQYNNRKRVVINVKAGAVSFHHGKMWHGSNLNRSKNDRISISCHFMPVNSKFHSKINNPVLSHYKNFTNCKMNDSFFPITWAKNSSRSKFLSKLKVK